MKEKFLSFVIFIGLAFILISGTIDLDNLFNYANQNIPSYIDKDNSADNPMDDKLATLGRVLFYDKKLSVNNTVACATCHRQENAFSDPLVQSLGFDGQPTIRHSMRLINARFSEELGFFWDQRVVSLEDVVTQPIKDPIEMGYSGTNGSPSIEDLILDLAALDYYQQLFTFTYGDAQITEERMQLALAQFIRSIQSFDSRFDQGLAEAGVISDSFQNFTSQENHGKQLFFITANNGTGIDCNSCHRASEFDADPFSSNNGIIGVAGDPSGFDLNVTRSPSLRDLVNPNGQPNGPFMHDGSLTSLLEVIDHYNEIPNDPSNTNLDDRLVDQNLNLTQTEKLALVAFLKTLTGSDVYTNEKWSNPFDSNGDIDVIGGTLGIISLEQEAKIAIYPNPVIDYTNIETTGSFTTIIFNSKGQKVLESKVVGNTRLDLSSFITGLYFIKLKDESTGQIYTKKLIKQ